MEEFAQLIRDNSDGQLNGVSTFVIMAMVVVIGLILIASVIALFTSIWLSIKYVRYNRKQNSLNMTGREIARQNLDRNGLSNIGVSATGSILFGNSYSHFFKKVRLRRLTWKKTSVSSMAMAMQKTSLAALDKNGDKDMKTRIALTPIIYFGPWALVPLVVIGVLLDWLVLKANNGIFTIVCVALGFFIYLISFILSIMVLKTEKKAQVIALKQMEENGQPQDEIAMCKKLFHLYNIEYVNNMVIALLELIYRILQLVAYLQNSSSSKNS